MSTIHSTMKRHAALTLVLGAVGASGLVGLVPSLAAADDDKVVVKDFALDPLMNLAYLNNQLVLHPKAMVSLGYNSNPFNKDKSATINDDMLVRGVFGVEGTWDTSETLRNTGNVELEIVRYFDEDQANMTGGTVDLKSEYTYSDTWSFTGGVAYSRFNDPLVSTGEIIKREALTLTLGAIRDTAETRLTTDVRGTWTHYLQDTASFTADARTNTTVDLNAKYAWLGADESEIYLRGQVGYVTYESNVLLQDGTTATLLGGVKRSLGTSLTGSAELGARGRFYQDNYNKDPAYDDKSNVWPVGNVALSWPWEEQSSLTARAYSELSNGLGSSAYSIFGLAIDLRYRLADRTILLAGIDTIQTKDTGAAANAEEIKRSTLVLKAGVEYILPQGVGLRLLGKQTTSSANIGNDYDKTEIWLDVGVAF